MILLNTDASLSSCFYSYRSMSYFYYFYVNLLAENFSSRSKNAKCFDNVT